MADNLWTLREQKRISIATLATRAGLPIGLIMEYESGQRSIEPRHLTRIAKALYVEESEIKLQSDIRSDVPALERQVRREPVARGMDAPPPPRPRERGPRSASFLPRPPAPPRPSQVAHLADLLSRLSLSEAELETEIGKPIAALDRPGLSVVLKTLQGRLKEGATANRRRGYLPESVDSFESAYLTTVRDGGETLGFTLFDGSTVRGRVLGFGPYSITVVQEDGAELTLYKLALVTYRREPVGALP